MSSSAYNPSVCNHSIVAANATGIGTSAGVASDRYNHGMQVIITGSVSVLVVKLQGTIDGTHWVDLTSWTYGTQASGDIVSAQAALVAVVANITSYTGSGTVDVYITGN